MTIARSVSWPLKVSAAASSRVRELLNLNLIEVNRKHALINSREAAVACPEGMRLMESTLKGMRIKLRKLSKRRRRNTEQPRVGRACCGLSWGYEIDGINPERHARQAKKIVKALKAQYRTAQGESPGFGGDKYVSPVRAKQENAILALLSAAAACLNLGRKRQAKLAAAGRACCALQEI